LIISNLLTAHYVNLSRFLILIASHIDNRILCLSTPNIHIRIKSQRRRIAATGEDEEEEQEEEEEEEKRRLVELIPLPPFTSIHPTPTTSLAIIISNVYKSSFTMRERTMLLSILSIFGWTVTFIPSKLSPNPTLSWGSYRMEWWVRRDGTAGVGWGMRAGGCSGVGGG
jgi:hypothetical protein